MEEYLKSMLSNTSHLIPSTFRVLPMAKHCNEPKRCTVKDRITNWAGRLHRCLHSEIPLAGCNHHCPHVPEGLLCYCLMPQADSLEQTIFSVAWSRDNDVSRLLWCGRERDEDRLCRAGCSRPETLSHILQVCPRTHESRIKRHEALTSYAICGLEQRRFHVIKEPHFRTAAHGLLKPDILATKDNKVFVIDAQVVTDGEPLKRNHRRKVEKYSALYPIVAPQFQVEEVIFHSMTLNWRDLQNKRNPTVCLKF